MCLIAFAHTDRDAGRIFNMISRAVRRWGFRGIKVHGRDAMPNREVCGVAHTVHMKGVHPQEWCKWPRKTSGLRSAVLRRSLHVPSRIPIMVQAEVRSQDSTIKVISSQRDSVPANSQSPRITDS